MKLQLSIKKAEEFIEFCEQVGYDCIQTSEGTLGIGDWILVSPDKNHWNYIIKEKYLNEWSSCQEIEKFKELPHESLLLVQELYDGGGSTKEYKF